MVQELSCTVLETIRSHKMAQAGDRVGVAVSGGGDSVALLLLLEQLREELAVVLKVVHLNHGLRGEASDADEKFVAGLAAEHGLEFLGRRESVGAQARARGWNLEDAGRRIRRAYFESLAADGCVDRVAVGHTADDQAETVLARILRGSGTGGLSGIYPVSPPVIRPLLSLRRGSLREYLRSLGQEWREDETNRDTSRLRARLRHLLLPALERDFSEHTVEHLGSLAEIARPEDALLSLLVEERAAALAHESSGGIAIRARDLLLPGLPFEPAASDSGDGALAAQADGATDRTSDRTREASRALARRMVRCLLQRVAPGEAEFGWRDVEAVLRLAETSQSGRELRLSRGVVVAKSLNQLWFGSEALLERGRRHPGTSPGAPSYEYAVELAEEGAAAVSVPEIGVRFRLKVVDWPQVARDTKNVQIALDTSRLGLPLVIRNWRPGDALKPSGRRGRRKLKELLLRARVPVRQRQVWPVLTSRGRLAWARGFPPEEEFCPGNGTQRVLLIGEEAL